MTEQHICDSNCNHGKFFNYHIHSVYSARDCINSIDDLYRLGKEYNQDIGITDHGNIGAWVKSYQTAQKYGMKWIPACEFYIHPNRARFFELKKLIDDEKKNKEIPIEEMKVYHEEFDKMKKYHHIVAIAKNYDGMQELMEIHNRAFKQYHYYKPLTSYQDFFNSKVNRDGTRNIILTTACLASTSSQYILSDNSSRAETHIMDMYEFYKDDLYLELQVNGMKEQKLVNENLIRIARKHKLPMTIANDAHYPLPEHGSTHQILLLLQGGNTIDDLNEKVWQVTFETKKGETKRKKLDKEALTFYDIHLDDLKIGTCIKNKKKTKDVIVPSSIVSEDEKWDYKVLDLKEVNKAWIIEADNLVYGNKETLRESSNAHPEITEDLLENLFENNMEINSKIEKIDFNLENKLPRFENEDETLREKCESKLKELGLYNQKYVKRFEYEYKIITKGQFASYFLVLSDIHSYCKQNNIPKGVGRGSSSSSLIAFLLGITLIDPLVQSSQLLFDFQRFLNPARVGVEIATIKTENGRKFQFFLDDKVVINRDGEEIVIEVKDLKEGDDFVGELK